MPVNARENAVRCIRFDSPERIVTGLPTHPVWYVGCNHEAHDGGGGHDCPVGTRWTDIWGVGWQKEQPGVMAFPRHAPLAEPAALKTYRWPDPDDDRICGQIHEQARQFPGGDVFLAGSNRDTVWEKAYMLVGMENLMVYFHTEPNFVREVFRRIMDFQVGIARHYLDVGIEAVAMSDDLGTQAGPLLGPATVEQFLVPQYRRLFDLYKAAGVIVNFHSCGRIDAFVETFMALGVDILNPVQATANDLDAIRAATAGRMALQGGVGTATIYDGPVERIVAETRQRLWQLGRDGGYLCCPDQGLPFPPGHLEALHDAVEQYGKYPIEKPSET